MKDVYNAVKTAIEENVPEVRYIDLWNHNVEFIEQESAWDRPAVFIEFGPITWEPVKLCRLRGNGELRLHVVTDWAEGGQTAAWDVSESIRNALEDLSGMSFSGMTLCQTLTNHNHEDILESIDSYFVRYLL